VQSLTTGVTRIAVGWSLRDATDASGVAEYLTDCAGVIEEAGGLMQVFVAPTAVGAHADWLAGLMARGHGVDLWLGEDPAADGGEGVSAALPEAAQVLHSALGAAPIGLRLGTCLPAGLEGSEGRQRAILDAGLTYVSSLYATKSPSGPYDVFADKNAYMIMKHHQPRRYPSGLVEVPMSGYSDAHFLQELGRPLEAWIRHLRDCADFAYDMGGLLYAPALHPDLHLRYDPQGTAIRALAEYVARKHDPVRFCTCREAADSPQSATPG